MFPFYLLAYRLTPNTTIGRNPFRYSMWGEMTLPNRNNLKAQITRQTSYHSQRLDSLKPGLKPAYKFVSNANRKTHLIIRGYMSIKLSWAISKQKNWVFV